MLIFLTMSVRAGLPVPAAAGGVLAIVLTQVLPGMVLWRLVRPRRGWWVEDVAVGFGLGIVLAVLAQYAAGLLRAPWLSSMIGPGIGLLVVAFSVPRARVLQARCERLPGWWGPSVAVTALLLLRSAQEFYRRVPLSWPSGFRSTYVDIPFHQALVGELAHRGPSEFPYVLGEPLHYHWFSHAWTAQVGMAGGVPLDAALLRLLPAVISVAAVVAVAAAGVRLGNRPWVGPLAALIAVSAGDLDVFGSVRPGALVTHFSPSAGLAVPLITTLLVLLTVRWRSEEVPWTGPLLAAVAFAAAAMKGSALPVVVAGATLAALSATALRMPQRHRVWRDVATLTAVLVGAVLLVFSGGAQGLEIDPVGATERYAEHLGLSPDVGERHVSAAVVLAVITLIAALARGWGLLAMATSRALRHDVVAWLLLGTGLAGAGAVVALSHAGSSQWYFLRAAGPALAIGSAIGILVLFDRCADRRRELLFAGIVTGTIARTLPTVLLGSIREIEGDAEALLRAGASVLVFGVVVAALALLLGRGRSGYARRGGAAAIAVVAVLTATMAPVLAQQLTLDLPDPAPEVAPTDGFAFSADQVEAARFIRDRSDVDDVVITNRHCSNVGAETCDSRRFHVAAYTERRVLVEGWAYTPRNGEPVEPGSSAAYNPFWDPELLALNDRFIRDPMPADRERLVELGVRWIFVDKTAGDGGDLHEQAILRHDSEWATVWEIVP